MTDKEIKKAWETMKKDLKKEFKDVTALQYGFTMNAKQIKNRTATFCATSILEYDAEIGQARRSLERVMGYTAWTDEEKAGCKERTERFVASIEAKKAKYGTREKEAGMYLEMIKNSNAFKKFSEAVGQAEMLVEISNEGNYMIRFVY